MWVYDVEVLDVRILDEDVKKLMVDAQRMAITSEVERRHQELRLASEKLKESVDREVYGAQIATLAKAMELEAARLDLHKIEYVGRAKNEAEAYAIATDSRVSAAEKEAAVERARVLAEVSAFKEQMAALHPELVATLKMLGNQHFAAELAKNVSPLAILGGASVTEVLEKLLGALPIGSAPDGSVKKVLSVAPKSKA
jgi:major vault protein